MKKFLALLLAAILVFSFAACNAGGEETEAPTDAPTEAPTQAPTEAPTQTPTEAPTEAPTEEGTEDIVADPFEGIAVMSHAEYDAAEMDAPVVIKAAVQATQSWWDNKIVAYLQAEDGAYLAYNMACSEEDAAKLVPGTKIIVKGYKGEYSGEIEILDATFAFAGGESYIATATDVTALLANEAELIKNMNKFVSFKGLTVAASKNAEGNDVAFLYKWNGSGEDGDDLYFNVTDGTNTYNFCVESYLCGKDTDVYKAVKELKIGDKIDAEGFLYWYNGVNPHITSVKVVTE